MQRRHCLSGIVSAADNIVQKVGLCLYLTTVPRQPLPVCLKCCLQTTSSLCQPRSPRRASPLSQQLWSAGFFCGRSCDMELVTRQSDRSGHQQRLLQAFTEDVFIFSLHSALELSARCALQIYLLTYYVRSSTLCSELLILCAVCRVSRVKETVPDSFFAEMYFVWIYVMCDVLSNARAIFSCSDAKDI